MSTILFFLPAIDDLLPLFEMGASLLNNDLSFKFSLELQAVPCAAQLFYLSYHFKDNGFLVCEETVVLRRCESETKFGFIKRVDKTDEELTLETSAF